MTQRRSHQATPRIDRLPRQELAVSWWITSAQPEQRAAFIDAAKVRHAERLHQANVKDERVTRAWNAAHWAQRGLRK